MLLLANKLIEKLPDPHNAKEHYLSFIRKKNTKLVKKSKVITQELKTFEYPNIVDIKSVIIEHARTSRKLSKTIRQAEKLSNVGSNSSLYSFTKKIKNFMNEKDAKITKQAHAFKGYANSYNVEFFFFLVMNYNLKILNLQLKIN